MADVVLALMCGALLLVILHLLSQQDQERREWARERTALMERCVPGLVLTEQPQQAPTPAYGTDAYEWQVQEARRKVLGVSDEII